MKSIESIDEAVFWWINNHHNTAFDWLFWTVSEKWSWLIFIAIVYCLVVLRKDRRNWHWVLLGIALCFLFADQISSNAIKDGVQRLRPCYALQNVRMFHTNKGGLYGFVSSHAANAFAISMFICLWYGKRRNKNHESPLSNNDVRTAVLPWIMFAWAFLVGYSRPYLGKHYPGDVLCGALIGIGVGAMIYFVISVIRRRISSRLSA
ncbi:MAG: phosphatase PAP2 family protein [Bacteroidales bacterium]|nr:phosphatase PAP2 family protein [Bacteroidales bacterium]